MTNDQTATPPILAQIREYYRRIDAGDTDWVIQLFAANAVYDRAGTKYNGQPAIREFYEKDRKIVVTHSGLNFWTTENHVFAEGIFDGKGADGSTRHGEFADRWTFDANGKVVVRRTSLFLGSEYVKR